MRPRTALRVGLKFAYRELQSPLRGQAPGLLRRGFLSDQRWLYPDANLVPDDYLSEIVIRARVLHLNAPVAVSLFKNKIAFQAVLEARGLADCAPRFHATVIDGRLYQRIALESTHGFVVKPALGDAGHDVVAVPTADQLIAQCSRWNAHVVQERIPSAGWAAELSPDALPTARVLTMRDPGSGDAFVAAASLRLGTRKSGIVDNFGAGGIAARIDVHSGELSTAVAKPTSKQRRILPKHPETGARIEGRVIPRWGEAVELAEMLMAAFPEAIHIAWDIYPGPDGPVLIEGNTSPHVTVFQAHGPFITDPRVRRFYAHHGVIRL